MKKHKYERILDMFVMLEAGKELSKAQLAIEYEVDERTIQRDIDDIRAYYMEAYLRLGRKEVIYDRARNLYRRGVLGCAR